jgi:uncharacterized protein (TIGR00288 family)
MDTPPNKNIAMLIDADNSPATKIDFIISELATYGVVNIRKAYGNWKKQALIGWVNVLHEYAIQPIQHFDLVKGKNATDMALLIDAMDILYTRDVQTFCLVSSDCDFTPLIMRLREDGKQVIGFGNKNTPEPFISSCTKFLYLEDEGSQQAHDQKKQESLEQLKQNTKLMNILNSAIKSAEDEEGWARLGPVGSFISNQGPFDHRTYGFKKLSDLFAALDVFDVRKKHIGNQLVIEVKRVAKRPKKKVAKKAAKKTVKKAV